MLEQMQEEQNSSTEQARLVATLTQGLIYRPGSCGFRYVIFHVCISWGVRRNSNHPFRRKCVCAHQEIHTHKSPELTVQTTTPAALKAHAQPKTTTPGSGDESPCDPCNQPNALGRVSFPQHLLQNSQRSIGTEWRCCRCRTLALTRRTSTSRMV